MRRFWIYQVLILIFAGCIDRIEVDTTVEPERLIVEGFITNLPSEYKIKLSKTIRFSNERNMPVSGAIVSILSADGDVHCFDETLVGSYISCFDYQVKPNITYKLRIEWEGKIIESTEQILPEETNFSNLKYTPGERIYLRKLDSKVIHEPGVYISTLLPETSGKRYYRWRLFPTFIFEADRASFSNSERCWVAPIYDFKDVYIHEDVEGEGGYDKGITFIPTSRDMAIDYSLLVEQYSISEEAYTYWNSLKKQKENIGSIFDTPPFSINSNMQNIEDPNDIVLGYFGVYNVRELRMKWNLEDLPFKIYKSSLCSEIVRGEPRECFNCLRFPRGQVTNEQPDWWE